MVDIIIVGLIIIACGFAIKHVLKGHSCSCGGNCGSCNHEKSH